MKYNRYFESQFAGCLLLAKAFDPHRNREVELRMLPGEFEVVGVSDGTDCWIAPVSGDPFSVSVKRILDGIREGKMPAQQRTRVRVMVGDAPKTDQEGPRRVRVSVPDESPAPASATRGRVYVRA